MRHASMAPSTILAWADCASRPVISTLTVAAAAGKAMAPRTAAMAKRRNILLSRLEVCENPSPKRFLLIEAQIGAIDPVGNENEHRKDRIVRRSANCLAVALLALSDCAEPNAVGTCSASGREPRYAAMR